MANVVLFVAVIAIPVSFALIALLSESDNA